MARKPVKYSMVNAFTDSAFKGNPAAVCLLEQEREEKWLQAVAAEFNAPMTCFVISIADGSLDGDSPSDSIPRFRLRWFTPVAEGDICGHGTMAAAHTLFTSGLVNSSVIEFSTLSGTLTAKRVHDVEKGEFIELDLPVIPWVELSSADVSSISKALNVASVIDMKMTATNRIMVVLPSEKDIVNFQPDFNEMQKCPGNGIIITAIPVEEFEFDMYSRFFFPKLGVNEDFICGSAHCTLAAYWSKKLGKTDFIAYAASPRSGILNIHLDEQRQRVLLRGKAITIMEGIILV